MSKGWIKLHRDIINWEWYTDINTTHLFNYCIINANFEDSNWRGIIIKKGQFIATLKSISDKTGLSIMQIRTSLKKLVSTQNITNKTTNKYHLISVVNYEVFQDGNKQITNKQQTNNNQITHSKKNKEYKNIRNIIKPEKVSDQTWSDFIILRKNKKSPITETVLTRISSEAAKAGISLDEALQECCARGWVGFKAGWYQPDDKQEQVLRDDLLDWKYELTKRENNGIN